MQPSAACYRIQVQHKHLGINTIGVGIHPLSNFYVCQQLPSKHLKAGHHWSACKTPFTWRFASGPMVAWHYADWVRLVGILVYMKAHLSLHNSMIWKVPDSYLLAHKMIETFFHEICFLNQTMWEWNGENTQPTRYTSGRGQYNIWTIFLIKFDKFKIALGMLNWHKLGWKLKFKKSWTFVIQTLKQTVCL